MPYTICSHVPALKFWVLSQPVPLVMMASLLSSNLQIWSHLLAKFNFSPPSNLYSNVTFTDHPYFKKHSTFIPAPAPNQELYTFFPCFFILTFLIALAKINILQKSLHLPTSLSPSSFPSFLYFCTVPIKT